MLNILLYYNCKGEYMEKVELLLKMPDTKRRELIRLQQKTKVIYSCTKGVTLKCDTSLLRQLYRLRQVMSENREKLFGSLLKNVKEPLDFVLRENLYNQLFNDTFFLRLLVSESITNRLIKACRSDVIPNWLIDKIEMCALAVELYYLNNKFKLEDKANDYH